MSRATIRAVRDLLLLSAHEVRFQPMRSWEAPLYIQRARALHRQLMALRAGGQ
jgi:hypothetical protein